MERLTEIINGVVVYVGPEHESPQGSLSAEMNSKQVRAVLQKLAAYEDTGLTPGEVLSTKMDMAIINAVFQNTEVERMKELVETDKDGRLVVLPCKVGDTVFILADDDLGKKTCVECIVEFVNIGSLVSTVVAGDVNTHWQYGATFEDIGKTVFLTREETEAALEEHTHA